MASMDGPEGLPADNPLASRRVLVVDDHPDTLEMLREACTFHGAQVITASSARAALELVQETPPDAVITDIGLRGEDGVWLLAEVRRVKTSIPVIALTGRSPEDALAAGFDAVMLKPADPWDVCEELRRLLGLPSKPRG